MYTKTIALGLMILSALRLAAQPGLVEKGEGAKEGYILFAPIFTKTTYLIDKCGREVHSWKSRYPPNQSVYLLPDGSLLRTVNDTTVHKAPGRGAIEKLDWDSKVLWSFSFSDPKLVLHHDICPLPNGNILAIVCDMRTPEEAIKKGRNPELLGATLWSEKIVELKPKGKKAAKIVWEWSVWDHLVQDFDPARENHASAADHPERININFLASKAEDWLHFNSVSYNAELDQVLIGNRNFSEIFVIDHSTTKEQSASHHGGRYNKGGDLLYRWGNPAAYNAGSSNDQKLFRQHNAHWIGKGLPDENKILVFNNGLDRPGGNYSSVELLETPTDKNGNYVRGPGKRFLPDSASWVYTQQPSSQFYSRNVSGAQRLENGNTLICEGANGVFFEIDKGGNIVWKYVNPATPDGIYNPSANISQNQVFRCTFYEPDYSGFKNRKLDQGKTIEPGLNECGD